MARPTPLYRSQQVKQGEASAASTAGMTMYQLMLMAGEAVFKRVTHEYGVKATLLVLCGGGNNGGDGYIVAKLAQESGMTVGVWSIKPASQLTGDAKTAYLAYVAAGGKETAMNLATLGDFDVVVDAMLGTGLRGEVRSDTALLIHELNRNHKQVVAIDVPSGLCSDTGQVLGCSVQAAHTVTFIGVKQGLVTGKARAHVGQLHFDGLAVDHHFAQVEKPSAYLDFPEILSQLKMRDPCAHKGSHGKALLVGGALGMGGAILIAAQACLRAGAGMTACLTESCHLSAGLTLAPEAMFAEWTLENIQSRLEWCDVIAFGPGIGCASLAKELAAIVNLSDKPKVIDADGLTMLIRDPIVDARRLITPHPGEAAKLLECTVREVESDRYRSVKRLQARYGGVAVLKGAGTLVCDGRETYVCSAGNPGMASAGMGDALTGIIVALLAQGLDVSLAARAGVMLHSCAADLDAGKNGQFGLLATDVIANLRCVLKCI